MADAHPPGARVFLPSLDPMSDCDKPSYGDPLAETDNYDSEDDKPLKMPESPPPSKRQYSCKKDKDGVLRYKPAPSDYKPKSPIEAPAWLSAVCSDISKPKPPTKHVEPYPTPAQLNVRHLGKRGAQEDLNEEDDIPALALCLAFCKDEVKKHKAREDKAKKDKARRDKAKKARRSLDKAMDEV